MPPAPPQVSATVRRWREWFLPGLLAVTFCGSFPSPFPLPLPGNDLARLEARELSTPLREAGERLRAGEFAEARRLAESVHRLYPGEIEPLLLLMEIEIAAGRPAQAKPWFARAAALNRHHPLVGMYQRVFKEIEHRRGRLPGQAAVSPASVEDRVETADSFKRGWFGTGALHTFPRVAIDPASLPPTMASLTRGIFLARTLEEYAREAMANRRFLQAYLYYTELIERHPEVEAYRIGKAETALEMGRAREARGLLLPLYARRPDDQAIKELLMRCTELKSRRRSIVPKP